MNLEELSRLTDEREVLEMEVEQAERTIETLKQKNLLQLAASAEILKQEKLSKIAEIDETLRALNRMSSNSNKIERGGVAVPLRGKALSIPAAYCYMNGNPDGKAIVAEEFWGQVKKNANEYGCWNVLFPVSRTAKGTLKKQAYIHWFRKKLGAVKLAWYLTGHPINEEENLYNECDNDLCVNPSHHYQGATGRIKKKRDSEVSPQLGPSLGELEEYASAVFMVITDKWDPNVGVPFKDILTKLVPKEIPDEESLRRAMQCKKAKSLFHLIDGKWYRMGHPQGRIAENTPSLDAARKAMEAARRPQ